MDILTSLAQRLSLSAWPLGLSQTSVDKKSGDVAAATEATTGDDTIIADLEGGLLNGGGGNDRLLGRRGDDRLLGAAGNDFLTGAAGDDSLFGGSGSDRLIGGGGKDLLKGGAGADNLKGGGGGDVLIGGGGEDTLNGGGGADTLRGGGGSDSLKGGGGGDALNGGGGDDTLTGGGGADTLNGSRGGDRLAGDGGSDLLIGAGGADILFGGGGDDNLKGGADSDFLSGEVGADSLFGEDGADTLDGGEGDDLLSGGAAFDQLSGGEGADTLEGGSGNNTLTGGAGADRFVYAEDGGIDTITDFSVSEGDRIDLRERGIRRTSEFDVIEQDSGSLISFRGAGEILVAGVAASDLSADAFVFEDFTPAQSIVTGADAGAVTVGDGPLSLRLEVEDPDPDERFFIPALQEGIFGDFAITADGVWTFTVNDEDPETLALAEGVVGIDTFDVSTVDEEIFTLSVAVTGVNDAPQLLNDPGEGAVFSPSFVTDQFTSFNYSPFFVDFDNGDELTYALVFQPPGTSFFQNGDSGGLLSGVVETDSVFLTPPPGLSNVPFKIFGSTIIVTDSSGASVSVDHNINVTLRQFPADIGGDLTATLFEGVDTVVEGFLTVSDRNDGDDEFIPIVGDGAGPFTVFDLSQSGRWTYRFKDGLSEEAIATLRGATEGEVIEIQPLEVRSKDGTPELMSLRIMGSNDAPELVSSVPDVSLTTDDADDVTATLFLDTSPFFFDSDFSHASALEFLLDGAAFTGQREFTVGSHVLTLRATDPLGEFIEDVFVVTVDLGPEL